MPWGHVTLHKTSLRKHVVMSWKLTNYLLQKEEQQKKKPTQIMKCQVQENYKVRKQYTLHTSG